MPVTPATMASTFDQARYYATNANRQDAFQIIHIIRQVALEKDDRQLLPCCDAAKTRMKARVLVARRRVYRPIASIFDENSAYLEVSQ